MGEFQNLPGDHKAALLALLELEWHTDCRLQAIRAKPSYREQEVNNIFGFIEALVSILIRGVHGRCAERQP